MPFAVNALVATAGSAEKVNVVLWEKSKSEYEKLFRSLTNVNVILLSRRLFVSRFGLDVYILRLAVLVISLLTRSELIVCLGQKALVACGPIAHFFGYQTLYLNDEFPSCWSTRWRSSEIRHSSRCLAIVVPDPCRIEPLRKELNHYQHTPCYASIYNTLPFQPISPSCPASNDLLHRLGIRDNCKVVLNAGSIADWAQIPEVLAGIPLWRPDFSFLIHSRENIHLSDYISTLSHLFHDRVYWSLQPLSSQELASLIAAVFATTAFYRDSGPNIRYIGLSSGKIARSICCGTPVICSDLPSLSFIDDLRLGICVKHPFDIPDALEKIATTREEMSANCNKFAATYFNESSLYRNYLDVLALSQLTSA